MFLGMKRSYHDPWLCCRAALLSRGTVAQQECTNGKQGGFQRKGHLQACGFAVGYLSLSTRITACGTCSGGGSRRVFLPVRGTKAVRLHRKFTALATRFPRQGFLAAQPPRPQPQHHGGITIPTTASAHAEATPPSPTPVPSQTTPQEAGELRRECTASTLNPACDFALFETLPMSPSLRPCRCVMRHESLIRDRDPDRPCSCTARASSRKARDSSAPALHTRRISSFTAQRIMSLV